MKRFLRDNGLSIVLLLLFLAFVLGLIVSGWSNYNEEAARHGAPPVSLAGYVETADFGEALFENWESEFLQMGLYVILTAFLFQRGSAESKDPDKTGERVHVKPDSPGPVKRGGLARSLYRYSLSLAFLVLFLLSFAGHALCGLGAANEAAMRHGDPPLTLLGYLGSATFWFESFQNWQSEFLAVFAIVILSIWLRQEGSPESKRLDAPHSQTGE